MSQSGVGQIADLVPDGVAAIEIADTGQDIPLPEDEAIAVARAVEKRRREFALGRDCARRALARLGHADAVLPRAADGPPVWPQTFLGSITHTAGYAAAIAADEAQFLALGVDAERVGGVTDALMPRLFGAEERARLMGLNDEERAIAATIFFSAKEAYYKAWYPLHRAPLSFQALHIEMGVDEFQAIQREADTPRWRGPVRGRFSVRDDLVVTVLCLAR